MLGWLEQLSATGELVSSWPISTSGLVIGRGYACDVRLEDPFCAETHVRILPSDGGLTLVDQGSINGLQTLAGTALRLPCQIPLEQEFLLGKSRLRVRTAAYGLTPEQSLLLSKRPASAPEHSTRWLTSTRPLILASVALLALELLGVWLSASAEAKASTYLGPMLTATTLVLSWVAFWSLLSRLFGGAARFKSHLWVTLLAMLGFGLLNLLISHLGFMFLMPGLVPLAAASAVLIFAALVYQHLCIIGPEALKMKRFAVLGSLILAALGSSVVWYEGRDRRGGIDIEVSLKPPTLRLRPAISVESAVDLLDQLKPGLELARRKPLSGDGVFGGLLDGDD